MYDSRARSVSAESYMMLASLPTWPCVLDTAMEVGERRKTRKLLRTKSGARLALPDFVQSNAHARISKLSGQYGLARIQTCADMQHCGQGMGWRSLEVNTKQGEIYVHCLLNIFKSLNIFNRSHPLS
jgi:hypothetical protein